MIFNEIYSAYYNTVAKIISAVIDGKTDDKYINKIISDNAFGESILTVLPSLKNEKWQLIHKNMTTPLKNKPTMPLTLTQKQWLKAISLDPRIKLFDVVISGLDDIEPLFTPEDYYIYDKYSDGDPFEDETYIKNFKTVFSAMKNRQNIKIEMMNRKGKKVFYRCIPERLEYSEKDDKFRAVTGGCRFIKTINIARIVKCGVCDGKHFIQPMQNKPEYRWITLRVKEERNAIERCFLHFAHFEKRAERVDNHYLLHIKFDKDDEPEMVIRVLSFGPMVEVLESESFKNLIIAKLKSQKSCELK